MTKSEQARADAVVLGAWTRYYRGCPHHIGETTLPRHANALNIEFTSTTARCAKQPPSDWPNVGTASTNEMGFRWLGSGGSPLVFGRCTLASCPLRPEFCSECGHRRDAGHALGACRTHGEGAGGSWPCGCDTFRAVPGLR